MDEKTQLEKNIKSLQLSQLLENSEKHTKNGKLDETPVLIHVLEEIVDADMVKEFGKKVISKVTFQNFVKHED